MNARDRARSSISISRSSAGSGLWATASPRDIPERVNRHHGPGREFVHVPIDDALADRVRADSGRSVQENAVAFLEAAVAYDAKLGVRIERVMADSGSCSQSKMFRAACKRPAFAKSRS